MARFKMQAAGCSGLAAVSACVPLILQAIAGGFHGEGRLIIV